MKKHLFCITLFTLFSVAVFSQSTVYISTEESLSERETPRWFTDAKLGIFIHWGLYSVPAWATPTTTPDKVTDWKEFYRSNPYAEWYLNSLRIDDSPTQQHHSKTYGKDFDYYSFKDSLMARTKNWNADNWTDVFAASGAKYIVFTTKHHDGFTMYPSRIANPFMSEEQINSPRDFVGELAVSARERNLKFGVYYSGGLDWSFNYIPITNLWPDLFEAMPKSLAYTVYADCHLYEIIRRYKPDILWNDVNYPKEGDILGIFAELFNRNPKAVVNDRWEQYKELSDFTTPEYKVLDSIETRKWETCRGMGYSFGYNRVESDVHLLSSGELIHLLIDVVSKNGNLLLNVGPKADGTIPENQLKSLIDLGEWMKINSEGIYDTHPYVISSAVLADKTNIRFTRKNDDLYIFLLSEPKDKSLIIPNCKTSQSTKISLFGKTIESLSFSRAGNEIEIKLPKNMDFKFAKMIKVSGLGVEK